MAMTKSERERGSQREPLPSQKPRKAPIKKSKELKMVTNKMGKRVPAFAADGVGKMKSGGSVTKKKEGGVMKKKGYSKGGAVTKKKEGGKLTKAQEAARRKKQLIARQNSMVEAREGKAGSTPSEKNNAAKERMSKMFGMKLKSGGSVAKKKAGGAMKKKGYAKGGKVKAMSRGGVARGSGAARPQKFTRNG